MDQDQELIFTVGEKHFHVVPLDAIASWGELLGVSDEEALALILSEYSPPKQTDDPEDNGWTALYETLRDEIQTKAVVDVVLQGRVYATHDGMPSEWLTMLGRFGPEIVVAQTEALRENAQRNALAGVEIPDPPVDTSVVALVSDEVAARRVQFRKMWDPLVVERIG